MHLIVVYIALIVVGVLDPLIQMSMIFNVTIVGDDILVVVDTLMCYHYC